MESVPVDAVRPFTEARFPNGNNIVTFKYLVNYLVNSVHKESAMGAEPFKST